MSFVPTANSFGNILNQQGQQVAIQGEDPDILSNFTSLNRILTTIFKGVFTRANYVVGPAFAGGVLFGGSSITKPGQLQVQISSKGNPIQLKIAPFKNVQQSFFKMINFGSNTTETDFGWLRISNGAVTEISRVTVSLNAQQDAGTSLIQLKMPLPAFEFEDVVPAGTYTYQFYFQQVPGTGTATFQMQNVNVVAHELT